MSVLMRRRMLFEGTTEEGVERYTKMLDEMWRLKELVKRAEMT